MTLIDDSSSFFSTFNFLQSHRKELIITFFSESLGGSEIFLYFCPRQASLFVDK